MNVIGLKRVMSRMSTVKILLLISILISSDVFAKDRLTNTYPIEVIEVKDGDTLKVRVHQWLDTWLTTNIRVYGVDTPEKGWRGKCAYEKELGIQATEFTRKFVQKGSFSITNISNDKFGGRLDADVIRDDGQSLSEALITNGYGYAYFGKSKKSWCQEN